MHILVTDGALWDMGLMHCGIFATDLYTNILGSPNDANIMVQHGSMGE